MKIYFIEKDKEKLNFLEFYFRDDDVCFINYNFNKFMKNNHVQCVVSPANSFGLMDGGYDLAITKWFGKQLPKRVQNYIIQNFYGEQPVGSSFCIEAGKDNQFLIHTPTMRTPEMIRDERIVYQCMRSTLICALKNNIESILIPMFCGGVGSVAPQKIAELMKKAYDQVMNPPNSLDWKYANKIKV